MDISSKSTRLALVSAALAVVFWSAKALVIGLAGGLDQSRLEGPLYFAGLFSFLVGAVSLGVALTFGRPAWTRAIGGVAALVAGFGVSMAIGAGIAAMEPVDASWVWTEVELWVIAALLLAAAWLVARRRLA